MIYVYPADRYGCGHYRLIWPAQELQRRGYPVQVVDPDKRDLTVIFREDTNEIETIWYPQDAEVIVFQRITHAWLAQACAWLVAHGVAVVVDIDDDLAAIHPGNPAFAAMHPTSAGPHAWREMNAACRVASMVTVSTQALLERYAPHGRGMVLHNRVPASYLELPRTDTEVIGWPASLHSHPNDPGVLRGVIGRLAEERKVRFVVGGRGDDECAREFGLPKQPACMGDVPLDEWPKVLAGLGVGIAPLADTRFNTGKSWLKPLELSACGVPWVGSPRAEYRRFHQLGCGLLAERPRDWLRQLRQLLDSPALREDLSGQGRQVAAGWTIEQGAEAWWEAWVQARRNLLTGRMLRPMVAGNRKSRPEAALGE